MCLSWNTTPIILVYICLNLRSSPEQLLHWTGWLSTSGAGQWHGGVPAYRAPPAGRHCQPHSQQEERHPGHRQWPQSGGVEAEERASPWSGHRVRTPA